MVHVNVLDDRRGRCQKQGRYCRDGCRDRTNDGYASPEGTHAANDGARSNIIYAAAIACQITGENAFAKNTNYSCNQGHGTNNDGTYNDCPVESLSVLEADATYNGLGQCQGTDTNQ